MIQKVMKSPIVHKVYVPCGETVVSVDVKTYNALISSAAVQRTSCEEKWQRILVCYHLLFYGSLWWGVFAIILVAPESSSCEAEMASCACLPYNYNLTGPPPI